MTDQTSDPGFLHRPPNWLDKVIGSMKSGRILEGTVLDEEVSASMNKLPDWLCE
jgi:hypothetical protein